MWKCEKSGRMKRNSEKKRVISINEILIVLMSRFSS